MSKNRYLSFNRNKTEYIEYEFDEREQVNETKSGMTVSEDKVKEVESFNYLEFFVQKNGDFDEDVKRRIRCEWIK